MLAWFCLSVILFVCYRNQFSVVQFQNQTHMWNPHGTGQVFLSFTAAEGDGFPNGRRRHLKVVPKAPFPRRAREIPPKAGVSRVFNNCWRDFVSKKRKCLLCGLFGEDNIYTYSNFIYNLFNYLFKNILTCFFLSSEGCTEEILSKSDALKLILAICLVKWHFSGHILARRTPSYLRQNNFVRWAFTRIAINSS